jgi:hypothetical protein
VNLAAIETLTQTDLDSLVSSTSCLSDSEYLGRIDIAGDEVWQEIKKAVFNEAADLVTSDISYTE